MRPARLPARRRVVSHRLRSAAVSTAVKPSGGASKGLGIAALILGALGLLAGLFALVTAQRAT